MSKPASHHWETSLTLTVIWLTKKCFSPTVGASPDTFTVMAGAGQWGKGEYKIRQNDCVF